MNAIRKNTLLYQNTQRIGCLLKLDRRSFRLLLENLVYLWFQQMGNWWCVLTDSRMRFWTIKKRCWSFLVFKFLAHIISISILILQQCPSLVDRRTWSYGNRCFSPNSFRDRSGVWGVIAFIQMAEFIFGEGHSIDELATLPKRIMLSSMQALPKIFFKLCNQIFAGSNRWKPCWDQYHEGTRQESRVDEADQGCRRYRTAPNHKDRSCHYIRQAWPQNHPARRTEPCWHSHCRWQMGAERRYPNCSQRHGTWLRNRLHQDGTHSL